MTVTLRQLQAFVAVATRGGFTPAANQMKIAQPALSQLVKELEATLGVRLFDRTTRRVEMTEAGREFFGSATRLLADLDGAVDKAKGLASRQRGRVTVAAPPLLSASLLPHVITEMRRNLPGIEIAVIDAGADAIVEAVRSGEASCGVGTFAEIDLDMERRVVGRDNLMAFFRDDHPFAQAEQAPWRALGAEATIALDRRSGIRRLVEAAFEVAEVDLRPVFEVRQIYTALAFVEAGLGVAALPAYARSAILGRAVQARLLVDPIVARDITLLRRAAQAPSPALIAFENALRAAFSPNT
jgi:DNA-binding transcriptional LysR family regulator